VHDGILEVIGTDDGDQVSVNEEGIGLFKVHASFFPEGNFRPYPTAGIQQIVVRLCDGDDHATISGSILVRAILRDDGGDDYLKGGGGHDILLAATATTC
jgi:hypothetical protein